MSIWTLSGLAGMLIFGAVYWWVIRVFTSRRKEFKKAITDSVRGDFERSLYVSRIPRIERAFPYDFQKASLSKKDIAFIEKTYNAMFQNMLQEYRQKHELQGVLDNIDRDRKHLKEVMISLEEGK